MSHTDITDGFKEYPYRPWPKDASFNVVQVHPKWLDLCYRRADGTNVYLSTRPAQAGISESTKN